MSFLAGKGALVCRLLVLAGRSSEDSQLLGNLLENRLAINQVERDQFDRSVDAVVQERRLRWPWHLGVLLQKRPVFVLVGLLASAGVLVHSAWHAARALMTLI